METPAVTRYLDETQVRLRLDGCRVHTERWYGDRVIVGRVDLRKARMATLHLFTIVSTVPHVSQQVLAGFADTATSYAQQLGGSGNTTPYTGVAVLPCLVSPVVEPAALAWARNTQLVRLNCVARPAVVDVENGAVGYLTEPPKLLRVYAKYLREKLETFFPPAGQHAAPRWPS